MSFTRFAPVEAISRVTNGIPLGWSLSYQLAMCKLRSNTKGNPASICDALQAAAPGENTFPITSKLLDGVLTVTDTEVRYAMRVAFEMLQLVLEPSGTFLTLCWRQQVLLEVR
jgi:threonine dehydratase